MKMIMHVSAVVIILKIVDQEKEKIRGGEEEMERERVIVK